MDFNGINGSGSGSIIFFLSRVADKSLRRTHVRQVRHLLQQFCAFVLPFVRNWLWPPASYVGRRRHYVLPLSYRSFFRRLISEVAWPIVTKLCHMFVDHPNFGGLFPRPKFGGPKTLKFRRDFVQFRDLIAVISGTQQDIVNRKTALQTTDTPTQAHGILWSTNGKQ